MPAAGRRGVRHGKCIQGVLTRPNLSTVVGGFPPLAPVHCDSCATSPPPPSPPPPSNPPTPPSALAAAAVPAALSASRAAALPATAPTAVQWRGRVSRSHGRPAPCLLRFSASRGFTRRPRARCKAARGCRLQPVHLGGTPGESEPRWTLPPRHTRRARTPTPGLPAAHTTTTWCLVHRAQS